jgi:hypothetical protein
MLQYRKQYRSRELILQSQLMSMLLRLKFLHLQRAATTATLLCSLRPIVTLQRCLWILVGINSRHSRWSRRAIP